MTAVAFKPSEESALGIHIQERNGCIKVTFVASDSLFIGTSLNVSMVLENINGNKRTAYLEASALFKTVEGLVMIVTAEPQDSTTVIRSQT